MELPEGASVNQGELERVAKALDDLSNDPHGPREISISLTLHVHHDYPKILYLGQQEKSVADEAEEKAARASGFGDYDHEAYMAEQKGA